jgi:hypothetical protein
MSHILIIQQYIEPIIGYLCIILSIYLIDWLIGLHIYVLEKEAGWRKGLIAVADRAWVETDMYEKEVAIRPSNKKYRCFKMIRRLYNSNTRSSYNT